jgi:hypothetical protein
MTFVERATAKKIFIWISGPGVVQLRLFSFTNLETPFSLRDRGLRNRYANLWLSESAASSAAY